MQSPPTESITIAKANKGPLQGMNSPAGWNDLSFGDIYADR